MSKAGSAAKRKRPGHSPKHESVIALRDGDDAASGEWKIDGAADGRVTATTNVRSQAGVRAGKRASMATAPTGSIGSDELEKRGEAIYLTLQSELERTSVGKVVAIEVVSGDWFLGSTETEADRKAEAAHPRIVFYLRWIGPRELPWRMRVQGLGRK